MLLALDISTSCVGWSLWKDEKLKDYGFYCLTNSKREPKELDKRLDKALEFFLDKFKGVDTIAAEEALKRFSGGKTTANTMNKLISMNFALTYNLSRKWNADLILIPVNKARKLCGIKIPRQQKGKKKDPNWTKNHIIKEVANKYPMIIFEKTKAGNYRKGYDDLADSIVIGESAFKNGIF